MSKQLTLPIDEPMLEGWRAWRNLPAGTTRPDIERRLAIIRPAVRPAGPKGLAVALAPLFDWADAFGVRHDPAAATRIYLEELGEYATWALVEAVKRTLRGMRSTYSLPLPGVIIENLPSRARALRAEWVRLTNALEAVDNGRIDAETVPLSPDEIDQIMRPFRERCRSHTKNIRWTRSGAPEKASEDGQGEVAEDGETPPGAS